MDDTITTIYCLSDEFLKAMGHRDDPQARLSTAEVMTVPLVAAAFFGGNIEATRSFMSEYGYMPKMISKSRLNRRIHAIKPSAWEALFALLAEVFKERASGDAEGGGDGAYVVDSLPVPACDNIRIRRCRLYPPEEHGEAFRGYVASKRRYFYGLRVHLVVSGAGEPVEFSLAAGSEADVKVFKELDLDLPEGSTIHADKGYTDYLYEDLLEEVGVKLLSQRKKNSKRPHSACTQFLAKPVRQYIETVFSRLSAMFSRKIHAVTPRGFELKIVCFLLAFSIQCL
ncbi:MAG: IS982 family transposase [Actinomycetota bacterium]|nr:IS982 family transposase [Actinomycetota bacterium]MDQ3499343.1 IS982 family transposase [Actinomycetota bacterium]